MRLREARSIRYCACSIWCGLLHFVSPLIRMVPERNATVTMDVGKVVEEARREIERTRLERRSA